MHIIAHEQVVTDMKKPFDSNSFMIRFISVGLCFPVRNIFASPKITHKTVCVIIKREMIRKEKETVSQNFHG